jgi:hypothetical protein
MPRLAGYLPSQTAPEIKPAMNLPKVNTRTGELF